MSHNNSVDDLTAKLEKLEQKITLTLQEIDHNFSTCHHRVTTKILPQIMRYGELSEEIFNNSQYWLMFYNQLNSIKPRNSISLSSVSSSSNRDQINNKSPLLLAQPQRLLNNRDSMNSLPSNISLSLINNNDSISSTPLPDPPQFMYRLIQSALSDNQSLSSPSPSSSSFPNIASIILEQYQERRQQNQLEQQHQMDVDVKGYNQQRIKLQSTPSPLMQRINQRLSQHHHFPQSSISTTGTDSDLEFTGISSPPVRVRFSVEPSKLLKTPAKEAAQMMTGDILNMVSPVSSTKNFK